MPVKFHPPQANYKNKPKEADKRAEFYRVAEGFTVGNRVCLDGEIFHVSELDAEDPEGYKVASFRPLPLKVQEQRFGRVMYLPYEPTEEELEELGYMNEEVRASDTQAQELSLRKDEYKESLKNMDEEELRQHAMEEYGQQFPEKTPAARVRVLLTKLHAEKYADLEEDPEEQDRIREDAQSSRSKIDAIVAKENVDKTVAARNGGE